MTLVLDVARERQPASSGPLDPLDGYPGVFLLLWEVADRHVRPFTREGDRDGSPDAAVTAGDEGHAIGEAAEADVRFLSVIRLR